MFVAQLDKNTELKLAINFAAGPDRIFNLIGGSGHFAADLTKNDRGHVTEIQFVFGFGFAEERIDGFPDEAGAGINGLGGGGEGGAVGIGDRERTLQAIHDGAGGLSAVVGGGD